MGIGAIWKICRKIVLDYRNLTQQSAADSRPFLCAHAEMTDQKYRSVNQLPNFG